MIDKNVLPSRHRAPCQSVSTGDAVTYTLTTASLIQMVNLSTNLINNTTAQVFRASFHVSLRFATRAFAARGAAKVRSIYFGESHRPRRRNALFCERPSPASIPKRYERQTTVPGSCHL